MTSLSVLFDNSYLGLHRAMVCNLEHFRIHPFIDLPEQSDNTPYEKYFVNLQVPGLRLSFHYAHLLLQGSLIGRRFITFSARVPLASSTVRPVPV